jgi:hypothetical protein
MNDIDREALEGILGSLRWHKNLWFISLTSSTLHYVGLTFLHNQTRWSHVFYMCAVPHHGNYEGSWSDLFNASHLLVWSLTCFIRVLSVWSHTKDDMLYSRWTCHGLWCRHVCHTCGFRMSNMRGKDTLHSNRGCLRLDAVHAAVWRMDTVSIVNGNVCGHFRDVLARAVCFLQVH